MSNIDDGGPAFAYGNHEQGGDAGMTLRDWFAGQALPGLIAGYATAYGSPTSAPDEVCDEAYKYADAMITRRKLIE